MTGGQLTWYGMRFRASVLTLMTVLQISACGDIR